MTESDVRALFFKNYSGKDLNEDLIVTIQEVSMIIIRKSVEHPESLPDIVEKIMTAKNRLGLFAGMMKGVNPTVPMRYLDYFDEIRKTMVDVVRYTRDNLDHMDAWFKDRFHKDQLEMISRELEASIERAAQRPANIRAFYSGEIILYDEFFSAALIGILGKELFVEFAKEYNESLAVLRQCQRETEVLFGQVDGIKKA